MITSRAVALVLARVQQATTIAKVFVPVGERERTVAQRRRVASAGGVLVGAVLWYLMLARLHVAVEAMPWYVTCAGIAVACACTAIRGLREGEFVFVARGAASAERRPLSLLETWAATYFVCALGLYVWVLVHSLMPPAVPPRVVQVVDIQLESPKDFANRESPMPGSEEQKEMHKRRTDEKTVQGDFAKVKAASTAKVMPVAEKQPVQPQIPQKHTKTAALTEVKAALPASLPKPQQEEFKQVLVKPAPNVIPKPQQKQAFVMEEVQPPEMVEMIENDGEADAAKVFETGGSSEGGKGAANELSTFIKELHKRIKLAWAPPRGQTHEARILFRIKRDGTLAFVRVQVSSGDVATDEAALKAVTTAARAHKHLPDGYQLPFLDVQYTFKYTADELKEVQTVIHEL